MDRQPDCTSRLTIKIGQQLKLTNPRGEGLAFLRVLPVLRAVIEVGLCVVVHSLCLFLKSLGSLSAVSQSLLNGAQVELREETFKRLSKVFSCVMQSLKRLCERLC